MNTSALVLMSTVWIVVTLITIFFFYKVLTSKPKSEPDSYSENDRESGQ
jgi:hypothetical protein